MKIQNLIKASRYPIRINQRLIDAITDYCQSNNLSDELKAKMLILTGFVYDRQMKFDTSEICVPQNLLRKLFSNKLYQKILYYCENSTIQLTRNANAFSNTAKHYKVKNELFDKQPFVFYPNVSVRYEKVLNRFLKEKYERALQLDTFYTDSRVEIQNLFLQSIREKFTFEKVTEFADQLIKRGKVKTDTIETYKTLFLCNNPYLFNVSNVDKNGRVYDIFTYCKKEFRDLVKDDFNEVDISNSHPFILGSILKNLSDGNQLENLKRQLTLNIKRFEKSGTDNIKTATTNLLFFNRLQFILKLIDINYYEYVYNNTVLCSNISNCVHFNRGRYFKGIDLDKLKVEIDQFYRSATNGNFYEVAILTIKHYHKNVQFAPLIKYLNTENSGSKLLYECQISDDSKKAIVKISFMYWMNGNNRGERYKVKKLFPLIFPNITMLFNLLKKEFKHNSINGFITTIESDLIYSTIYNCYHSNQNFIVGSVHDAFFVRKENQKQLEAIFEETAKRLLNNVPKIKTK